jgi:hypothetical protein
LVGSAKAAGVSAFVASLSFIRSDASSSQSLQEQSNESITVHRLRLELETARK